MATVSESTVADTCTSWAGAAAGSNTHNGAQAQRNTRNRLFIPMSPIAPSSLAAVALLREFALFRQLLVLERIENLQRALLG